MEAMIDYVAKSLGLDPDAVRQANLYKKDQVNKVCVLVWTKC